MSIESMLMLYVAAGCLMLVVILAHEFFRHRRNRAVRDMLEEHEPPSPRRTLVERCVIGCGAAAALVLVWPLGLGLALYERVRPARIISTGLTSGPSASGEKSSEVSESPFDLPLDQFQPEPKHLVERLTRHAIEERELVADPMGAVPPLPCGHLHRRWQTFAAGIEAGDELWSFEAAHVRYSSQLDVRRGYARLHGGQVLDGITVERTREE